MLCGDFNVVPAAIDSYDEESLHGSIFHTDEERARFERLLAAGFVDVFRAVHPELQAFSWWDYRGGAFHRKHGLRIDLLLASAPRRLPCPQHSRSTANSARNRTT